MGSRAGQRTRGRAQARPDEVRTALDALRRLVQALRADARHGSGRQAPLSHAQLFALQQIAAHPRSSINEVAALTYTHQSSVSVVVQKLVRRRLVSRVSASEDRRRQQLVATRLGHRMLAGARATVPERVVAAISALPAAARRALATSLTRIAHDLSPARTGGSPPMFLEDARRRSRRG